LFLLTTVYITFIYLFKLFKIFVNEHERQFRWGGTTQDQGRIDRKPGAERLHLARTWGVSTRGGSTSTRRKNLRSMEYRHKALKTHKQYNVSSMAEVTTATTDCNDRPVAVGGIGNYAFETKFYPNNVHILCFPLFSICNYSFILRYSHLFSKKFRHHRPHGNVIIELSN